MVFFCVVGLTTPSFLLASCCFAVDDVDSVAPVVLSGEPSLLAPSVVVVSFGLSRDGLCQNHSGLVELSSLTFTRIHSSDLSEVRS